MNRLKYSTIILMLIMLIQGCANMSGWKVQGIPVDKIRNASAEDIAEMFSGFILAMGTHFAGHVFTSKVVGANMKLDGLTEIYNGDITDSDRQWLGRSGWILSIASGYAAKSLGAKGYTWEGYRAGVVFQTATYPLWSIPGGGNDVTYINDAGGNGELEWGIASTLSAGLYLERGHKP